VDELHVALIQGFVALHCVAGNARQNHIGPCGFSAPAPGNDMIDRQFFAREIFPAVLTGEMIALIDVPPVEFYVMFGKISIAPEKNHLWSEDLVSRGVNEIAFRVAGKVFPGFIIVYFVLIGYDARKVLVKKGKSPPHGTNMDRHPMFVQNENVSLQNLHHGNNQGRKKPAPFSLTKTFNLNNKE
jgi:hypothetical protein